MNNINTKKRNLTGKAFACAVLVIVLFAVLTSCTPVISDEAKEKAGYTEQEVTADFFEEKARSLGYTTEDVTDQYTQEDFNVIKGIAINGDCFYVTFFETDGNDSAELAFNTVKKEKKYLISDATEKSSVSIGTFQKYTLTSQGLYFLAERVGTTFISANCHDGESQKVTELLDAIGY